LEIFRKKDGGGGEVFCCFAGVFEGCFGKNDVLVVVNRGEVVVDCMVNVDIWMSLFRGLRIGHLIEIYFSKAAG
jgi:hypothetical protein